MGNIYCQACGVSMKICKTCFRCPSCGYRIRIKPVSKGIKEADND